MKQRQTNLKPYTLKLCNEDKRKIKLICALDRSFQYQYQMFDAAVAWASENRDQLIAIANVKDGDHRTYYLSHGANLIEDLEAHWNCNKTRALYTAVISYLAFRQKNMSVE